MSSIIEKLKQRGFIFNSDYTKGASYLFQNGQFLNLNEQSILNKTVVAHHVLDNFIIDNNILSPTEEIRIYTYNDKIKNPFYIYEENERILKYTDNAIVLNDATNYIFENCYVDLPLNSPTELQYMQLLKYFDRLIYKKINSVFISLDSKVKEIHLKNIIAEDIIKEIRQMYICSF